MPDEFTRNDTPYDPPDDDLPQFVDDDDLGDDDFQLWTFDTDDQQVVRTSAKRWPAPVQPAEDALDDENAEEDNADEFQAVNLEPHVDRLAPAPALALPHPIRRLSASRGRRPSRPPGVWLSTLRTLVLVGAAALLVSTIFSLWTRPNFFTDEFRAGLNQVQATQRVINIQPTPLPTETRQIRIGVIAGHSGPPQDINFESDPGAVCPDGFTEAELNLAVAKQVVTLLTQERFTVDLLEEFDPRLAGYHADVLVSVHTNDCQDYGDAGTGYNAASASGRQTTRGADERLLTCLITQYGLATGLPNHTGITYDMTDYHTFGEVSSDTPTAIIEIGFLGLDRPFLTQHEDRVALGIANGIRCFLAPELYGVSTSP